MHGFVSTWRDEEPAAPPPPPSHLHDWPRVWSRRVEELRYSEPSTTTSRYGHHHDRVQPIDSRHMEEKYSEYERRFSASNQREEPLDEYVPRPSLVRHNSWSEFRDATSNHHGVRYEHHNEEDPPHTRRLPSLMVFSHPQSTGQRRPRVSSESSISSTRTSSRSLSSPLKRPHSELSQERATVPPTRLDFPHQRHPHQQIDSYQTRDHGSPSPRRSASVQPPRPTSEPETGSPPASAPREKQSRYLREMDRRAILARIAKGEKQSVLAREYKVSRSTICNLYKQRDEVLARSNENPHSRHPKKSRLRSQSVDSKSTTLASIDDVTANARDQLTTDDATDNVVRLQSPAVGLLFRVLQDRTTALEHFERSHERLVRLVVEEGLTRAHRLSQEHCSTSLFQPHTPPMRHNEAVCGVMLSNEAKGMMRVFEDMEPRALVGYLSVNPFTGSFTARLPPAERQFQVLLLGIATTSSESVFTAVDALRRSGVDESRISLVTLVVSNDVVDTVRRSFPRVGVITAKVLNESPASSSVFVYLNRLQQQHG